MIREVTLSLLNHYKVEHVLGIRGGFNGMTTSDFSVISLSADVVKDCHHQGGSILGSSRGGFDIPKMLDFLSHHRVNQLYIIGGDGTHRGANALSQAITERKLNIAVIGIPKTIDNDVDLIDRSFGFQTSVEAAQHAISSAKTEARCNLPNGIGIVKLMGRSSGFIASYAALGFGKNCNSRSIILISLRVKGTSTFVLFPRSPSLKNICEDLGAIYHSF